MKLTGVRRPPMAHMLLATALGIPFVTSSLGGLTHRVSCRTPYTAEFDVLAGGAENAAVSSSIVLSKDAPAIRPSCPGFVVDAQVNPVGPKTLSVVLSSTNKSTKPAHLTAAVAVNGRTSFVRLGVLGSGKTAEKTLVLHVPAGASTFRARLLVGG